MMLISIIDQCYAGRPLLLVAGRGQTASIWTPDLLKNLAQGRQVTIFDNRGIGLSYDAEEDADITVLDYADSTADLIDALQLDQPDILGWSLGGYIVLSMVTSNLGVVNRVILADTTSGGNGYSAASKALRANIQPFTEEPIPPNFFYPDTHAGNLGLCRFNVFEQAMPQDPISPMQAMRQISPIAGYIASTQVFEQLSNINNTVLGLDNLDGMVVFVVSSSRHLH